MFPRRLTPVIALLIALELTVTARADCSLEGHPICYKKCSATCRVYYDPGPPESCQTDCRNFLVVPGVTLKIEGLTKEDAERIQSILPAPKQ